MWKLFQNSVIKCFTFVINRIGFVRAPRRTTNLVYQTVMPVVTVKSVAVVTVILLVVMVTQLEMMPRGYRFQPQRTEPLTSPITQVTLPKYRKECSLTNNTFRGNVTFGNQITPEFLPEYKNPCWRSSDESNELLCVPYFYLAGFPKCGTTDLYARLEKHPHIIPAKTKEPHYLTHSIHYRRQCTRPGGYESAKTSCAIYEYIKQFFGKIITNFKYEDRVTLPKGGYTHPSITVDGSSSTSWENKAWTEVFLNRNCSEIPAVNPQFVKRINPQAKVIFILRDPVERQFSDYMYFSSTNISMERFHQKTMNFIKDFNECLDQGKTIRTCTYLQQVYLAPYMMIRYINAFNECRKTTGRVACQRKCGHDGSVLPLLESHRHVISMYHVYIQDWLDTFPRKNLFIFRTEDYHKNMAKYMNEIFEFLELPALDQDSMAEIVDDGIHNKNSKNSHMTMFPSTRRLLEDFYRPHNARLAELLGDPGMTWHYGDV